VPISEEMLEAFGLSSDSIMAAAGPFDLEVSKTANVSTITSGGNVTYTITVKNNGSNAAPVVFQEHYPSQMSSISYTLSVPATPNLSTPPTMWLFDNNLASGETAFITITGKLQGGINTVVKNTADVIAFEGETNTGNNSDEINVTITGGSGSTILYFPIIFKAPPRVLLGSDDFSDDDSGWPDNVDTDVCDIEYTNNEYQVKVYEDETCWIAGPKKYEYVYAEYQVTAWASSGDGKFEYGIYMNGAGGDYYYRFSIRPDEDCGWTLFRNGNGDETDSGGCHSDIKRGSARNNLKIIHYRDGKISVYVNDTLLHTESDGVNGDLDGGKGMGFYIKGDDTEDVTIRFDDFKIYSVPQ
jgi:uncharacterized repeat protein (TIGR01451 family)